MRTIPAGILALLKSKSMIGAEGPVRYVYFPDYNLYLDPSNITIDREEAADSQRCIIEIINSNDADPTDMGYYTPYRNTDFGKTQNDWHYVIVPGHKVQVLLGYGANNTTVFTGEIDEVTISAKPKEYKISIDCRCLACWLVDQQVKLTSGGVTDYYIEYPLPDDIGATYWLEPGSETIPDISDIVKDLCMRAGFAAADVIIETSGITLDPEFEKMSYMDCINELCTAAGFVFWVDEDGKCRFCHQTDREPSVTDETHVAGNFVIANPHVVSGSDLLYSAAGQTGTHWIRNTNYTINLITGAVTNINMTGTVYCTYVYAGWQFKEGEDIYSLDLVISRRNMYGTIRVAGDGDEGVVATSLPFFDTGSVKADKVLFADNQYLDSEAKCTACANRLQFDMLCRYICCNFATVGNPWLQIGDNIMIVESSTTISEVYKILSMSHNVTTEGFTTTLKTYHVGYTPL